MLKRFGYWIKKNLALVIVAIFLLTFIIVFAKLNWNSIMIADVEEKTNMLTNVFVSFAAIWAVYEFMRKNRRARAEKAIELAKEFEKNIMPLINQMSGLFEPLNCYKKIKELDMHDGLFFDNEELETLFTKDEINEYNEFCKILASGDIVRPKLPAEIKCIAKENNSENKEKYFVPVVIYPIEILNKLEAFSMAFNHKVADESVVYQSLHQMFFTTVKTLYIKIATINKYEKDKYYTNVIKLFNDWDKRYKKITKKNKKKKERILNNFKEV